MWAEDLTLIGKMRLRCLDTVRGLTVIKNSILMRDFDTVKGIQPITGRVSVTSDTLAEFDCARNKIIVNTRKYLLLL